MLAFDAIIAVNYRCSWYWLIGFEAPAGRVSDSMVAVLKCMDSEDRFETIPLTGKGLSATLEDADNGWDKVCDAK